MEVNTLKTLVELKEIVEKAREEGKKIVTTNGCYDIIHKGHINILQRMASLGDIFIVCINSDASVKRFKGDDRPYNNEQDRAYVINSIKGVDYVIIFDEDSPLDILGVLKPHVHAKGGAGLCHRIKQERELIESWNGKMVCLELIDDFSSTNVIEKIKASGRKD